MEHRIGLSAHLAMEIPRPTHVAEYFSICVRERLKERKLGESHTET